MWKLQDLESTVIWSEKERYVTQNDEKSKIHDDSVESHNYLRKDGARLSVKFVVKYS